MKTLQQLISLLLAVFLSACSSKPGTPTEADARAALEQDMKNSSQGCIKLVDFHKTGEKGGEDVMLVKASATIEFLEDCNWLKDTAVLVTKTVPGGTPNVRKGEQRTIQLTLQFHKSGRGWKAAP